MGQVINTNIMSLNAQRNLNTSQSQMATSLQRLSSGLRINSAKDDAAGMAISERFTTQIRGLNQAIRNASDGISLSQTAESAMGELNNNLQRIRELAVQSANATNSTSDRAALDAEVQQRIAEITRIASQTSFNGQKILDGSFGSAQFQVGANVGETISVDLSTGVRADQMGQIASETNTVTTTALTDGGLTIAVGSGEAVSVGASVDGSAQAKADAINAASISGLTATASNSQTVAWTNTTAGAGNEFSLSINSVDIFTSDISGLDASEVAAQVNVHAADTGVRAEVSGTDIVFTAVDGRDIEVAQTAAGAEGLGTTGTLSGSVTLSAAENITLAGENANIGFGTAVAVDASTLADVSVTSVANANDAIQRIDSALESISALRSDFGAIQNRFESTISNLNAVTENLSASRSRIQDADFAAETAALTRAQILQQAGVAILSQANAAPQSVLGLLR